MKQSSTLPSQLKILLAVDFLVLVGGAMLVAFYALYTDKIGASVLDTGIAAAVFAVVAGLTSLVAGRLTDAIRRKYLVIVVGYLLIAVGFMAYTLIDSVWQLMVLQAFVGLAVAFYQPAFDALYGHFVGGAEKGGSRWGAWESVNYFSIAVGAAAGAVIIENLGFEAMFVVMSSLCLIAAATTYYYRDRLSDL